MGNCHDADVIIVGGGSIGLASALHLLRAGRSVRLIEQGSIGSGASFGNCGLVSPSMADPLASPGMVFHSLKLIFATDSPLSVKVRPDINFASWAWNFFKSCDWTQFERATTGRASLLASAKHEFKAILQNKDVDIGWRATGLLVVGSSGKSIEELMEGAQRNQRLGIASQTFDSAQTTAFEPSVRPDNAGSIFYPGDAQVEPAKLGRALHDACVAEGLIVHENTSVTGFTHERGRIEKVLTDSDTFRVNSVVLTGGSWTPKILAHLGVRCLIEPGSGYSLTVENAVNAPKRPILLKDERVAIAPWTTSVRIGGAMEFRGYDKTIAQKKISAMVNAVRAALAMQFNQHSAKSWAGWRPMTPDDMPLIGKIKSHRNLFVNSGHGMLGVSMAPAAGKLLAELLTGTKTHIDPSYYDPNRFARI